MFCFSGLEAAEQADRLSRRRTVFLWTEVALFFLVQGYFFIRHEPDAEEKVMMLIWAVALLLMLTSLNGLLLPRAVRRLMNDEVSIEHRREGQRWGFWGAMMTTMASFAVSIATPVTLFEAARAVLTVGIGAALLRYAWLERRAERAG